MDGVALAEKGGAQGAVLDVAEDGHNHMLLNGGPARVRDQREAAGAEGAGVVG